MIASYILLPVIFKSGSHHPQGSQLVLSTPLGRDNIYDSMMSFVKVSNSVSRYEVKVKPQGLFGSGGGEATRCDLQIHITHFVIFEPEK